MTTSAPPESSFSPRFLAALATSTSSNSNNEEIEEPVPSLADILFNGQLVEAGAKTTVDRGNMLLTIVADQTKLENRLAAEEQGASIT